MADNKTQIREKAHRLPPDAYVGQKTVAFTICAADRQPIFECDLLVQKCTEILQSECQKYDCDIPLFCFMPDHYISW